MKTYILVLCKIHVALSCEPQQWYEVLDYINGNKIRSKLSKCLFFLSLLFRSIIQVLFVERIIQNL